VAGVQDAEQGHDLPAGGLVEVAGRLVGEHDGRVSHQGSGDRDALLLAAGQLAGPVRHPVAEAHQVEHGRGGLPPAPCGNAPVEQGGGDVVECGQRVEQEELLEDDADAPGPQARERAVGQHGHVLARDPHRAAGGTLEAGRQVQQGALART